MFVRKTHGAFVLHSPLEKLIGVFIINTSGLSGWKRRESAFGCRICFLCFVVKSQCLLKTPHFKTQHWALL